ncbi:hypothetical protein Tco_0477908 [Tanacetum coccineum]
MVKIHTDKNVADLLTKAFDVSRFQYLIVSIGMMNTFFLGLQVQQKKDGIFISQDKYVVEILKKFGFTKVKTISTPMETQKPLLKDEDGEEVNPKISHLHAMKRILSARNRQWLQIPQQKLNMWMLQVAVDKCFGFRINYLIMGKAKKSVRLMMEKLFGMELELIPVTQS